MEGEKHNKAQIPAAEKLAPWWGRAKLRKKGLLPEGKGSKPVKPFS